MADRPTRKNGCAPPFTPAQVSTWIFLPVLVAEFVVVISLVLPLEASIPCTVVFFLLAAGAVAYAYLATTMDPSDPRLVNHRCQIAGEGNGVVAEINAQDPTKQCWICDIQVGTKSMHCKFCNKCVDHFDHHCMCTLCNFWNVAQRF